MSKGHLLFLLAFIITVGGLYLFGQTKEKSLRSLPVAKQQPIDESSFNFENYLNAADEGADTTTQLRISELNSNLKKNPDGENAILTLKELVGIYDGLNSAVSGYYYSKIAELTSDKHDWISAGDRYLNILAIVDNPEMASEFRDQALSAFNKAATLDSTDLEIRVRIANVYLESGDDNVMEGVQGLLGVLKEDPENISANLLLGKFGIISGQFDKAIGRLEKVVSSQPQNAEALFLMAEAYRGSGRLNEAIEMLERCKEEIEDEQLALEIEAYIDKIK